MAGGATTWRSRLARRRRRAVLVVSGDRLNAKYVDDASQATRPTTTNGVEIAQMGPHAIRRLLCCS
jgi:hypothetical protein